MDNLKEFISNLELSEGDNSLSFLPLREEGSDFLETLEGDTGVMNFKSLCSFASGISEQRREDVLNSLLLAQRVATKAFPGDDQIMDWYKRYFEVLDKIGWIFENRDFSIFRSKSSLFNIENAILEILGSAITGNQLDLLVKTIDAFKKLGEKDKRLLAFEKCTHSLQSGSFQLGTATEVNNSLSLSASAFVLNTRKTITKILLFTSEKDAAEFRYCLSKATLNDTVFADAREIIKEKLNDAASFVAALEL